MDMGKNNQYGWGISQIPMPRACIDIYADRRRGQKQPMAFTDRRSQRLLRPFTSIFATSLREDFPALQTGGVALAAVLLLMLIGFLPRSVPPLEERSVPEPVEIVTRMLEETKIEKPIPPVAVVAAPLPKPLPEPVVEIVKPPVPSRPVVKATPVLRQVVSLPPAKEQPRPTKAPEKPVPTVERPVLLPEKTVVLSVPREATPLLTSAVPSRPKQDFTLASAPQQPLVADRSVTVPSAAETPLTASTVSPAADYRLASVSSNRPALAQGSQFVAAAPGTTVDLPTSSRVSRDFSAPRSQGGHAIARTGRSFTPETGQNTVAIEVVGKVAGSYVPSTSQAVTPLPGGGAGVFAGTASVVSVNLPDGPTGGMTDRVSGAPESSAGNVPPDSSVKFIGDGEGTADPDLFVSLNQLGACVDQGEEDRLRTELAIQLDKSSVFPCGSMRFYIDYVETGQTVQMRIYNPVDFVDKCAALLSAIECINHSR